MACGQQGGRGSAWAIVHPLYALGHGWLWAGGLVHEYLLACGGGGDGAPESSPVCCGKQVNRCVLMAFE